MLDNDNRSFDHYETTEHKMLDGSETGGGTPKKGTGTHFEFFGRSVPVAQMVAGLGVLVFFEVLTVASKADGKYGLGSAILLIAGFVGAFVIWLKKPSK